MADEVIHPFLPEQDYETEMSTYDFIYFVQDYTPFLREYLDYMQQNYIEYEDLGYYIYFIEFCNQINTNYGDDGTFERYHIALEPFMEWITEECGHMNEYAEQNVRNILDAVVAAPEPAQTGIASRTRSKRPATNFEIPPAKKGTNMISLEPTKQEALRIKLSDGKEYTYDEIKDMLRFSKDQTPLRHRYTLEDKQKIKEFLEFATKGGKKIKSKKTKKNKTKTKKQRKSRNKRKSRRH
jgi:hypothetical protein